MLITEFLKEDQWPTVYAMAQMLANEQTDVNELGKIIAYLRAYSDQSNQGERFFQYLSILVNNGKSVGHSNKTLEYYISIEKACKQHLQKYKNDASNIVQILGWVVRLMRYYKEGGSTDFIDQLMMPTRQAEIAQILSSQDVKIDDILEATITNIRGAEVTYTLLESIRLTQREHRRASSLSISQVVKVKITELRNDGKPKKLQLME